MWVNGTHYDEADINQDGLVTGEEIREVASIPADAELWLLPREEGVEDRRIHPGEVIGMDPINGLEPSFETR